MASDSTFQNLGQILRVIREHRATGELVCMRAGTTCSIYFQSGSLIHAQTRPEDSVGGAALHAFLIETSGRLVFHPAYVPQERTIDREQEAAFFGLVEDMQERGIVAAPAAETVPAPVDPIRVMAARRPVAEVTPVARPLLLLPPGQINTEVGGDDSPAGLLAPLNAAQFSGFVLYDDGHIAEEGTTTAAGVLIFRAGALETACWNNGDALITGKNAYGALVKAHRRGTVRGVVYDAAPHIIEIYRALIDGHNPYSNLDATSANFTGLRTAFKKAEQTGMIKLTHGRLTLYYAIYHGTYIGLFGLDAGGNQLCALNGQVPIALDKPGARLDIYLIKPSEVTEATPTPQPQPVAPVQVVKPAAANAGELTEAFAAVVRVLTNIAPPMQIVAELNPILDIGQEVYPFLRGVLPESTNPGLMWRQVQAANRDEAHAFAYVVNALVKPYARSLEPAMFATLLVRALGEHAQILPKLHIQLDCLMVLAEPAPAYMSKTTSSNHRPETANPFDF